MANANHRTLTQFKSALSGGGARPNLFEVTLTKWPTGDNNTGFGKWDEAQEGREFQFMCKAAALPASTLGVVEVPFRGRVFKVAGDKTFDTWTVTIINDEDFLLRSRFEQWVNGMNKLSDGSGATNPGAYMGDAYVKQLGRGYNRGAESIRNTKDANNSNPADNTAKPLRTYFLHDIWPSNVSAIDLSYDTTDTVEEFQVEFQVQYMSIGSDVKDATGGNDDNGTLVI